jgi:hypothetical protein
MAPDCISVTIQEVHMQAEQVAMRGGDFSVELLAQHITGDCMRENRNADNHRQHCHNANQGADSNAQVVAQPFKHHAVH